MREANFLSLSADEAEAQAIKGLATAKPIGKPTRRCGWACCWAVVWRILFAVLAISPWVLFSRDALSRAYMDGIDMYGNLLIIWGVSCFVLIDAKLFVAIYLLFVTGLILATETSSVTYSMTSSVSRWW